MSADHYSTLGVLPGADSTELRAAYLKLARSHHPDKFVGDKRHQAEQRMREINEAWNVLGVAHKRREYDATLPPDQRRRSQATTTSKRRGRTHFQAFDDDPITRADIDLDATPIAGSKEIPRWMAFLPVLLIGGGIVTTAFGTMVSGSGVVALGFISVAIGLVCFLMFPLFVMSRAERDPDL